MRRTTKLGTLQQQDRPYIAVWMQGSVDGSDVGDAITSSSLLYGSSAAAKAFWTCHYTYARNVHSFGKSQ